MSTISKASNKKKKEFIFSPFSTDTNEKSNTKIENSGIVGNVGDHKKRENKLTG